jgi:hypothetical protein
MADMNRKIQELLSDYAGALRDGTLPVFLKSLTRQEGRLLSCSDEFWEAAEVVRALNGVGFADKAVTADVGLFASRVDANIASRLKKAKSSPKRHTTGARSMTKTRKAEKPI